ncbi:hypothetical protein H4R19_002103 [Coemansia spiralis]|nr:hypothetical protein H4R19_002103 [Coemansia spiralis]
MAAGVPANGKVSILHLVNEGLLRPGNTVVCNAWPFSATVTPTGTFEAQWQPLPPGLVAAVGSEYMQGEFGTPSAWATAVCRVMRAQTRAQKTGTTAPDPSLSPAVASGSSTGGRGGARTKSTAAAAAVPGEIRVAVNGWTACRVVVQRDDPNRQLAQQLCSDASDPDEATAIEVPLDALRRELVARTARRGRTTSRRPCDPPKVVPHRRKSTPASQPMAVDNADSGSEPEQPLARDLRRTSAEIREITGAVDGLAKRVASDLALGCVKQRRAAAAAADAISAAASALSLTSLSPEAQQAGTTAATGSGESRAGGRHSRKRKSILGLSRNAKLSRVPTDSSSSSNGDSSSSGGVLDAATQEQLARFRDRAAALKRAHPELKALRYQRKQQLKRRISDALERWLGRRRRTHSGQLLSDCPRARPPPRSGKSSPQLSGIASPGSAVAGAFPLAVHLDSCANVTSASVSVVWLPGACVERGGAVPRLCALCGSAGSALLSCAGCGDVYHDFCLAGALPHVAIRRAQPVCLACRVCVRCLGGANTVDGLLQCGECGVHMHTGCSRQQSAHPGGLAGAAVENGRWVCDMCVSCAECGFEMDSDARCPAADGKAAAEWRLQATWAHDYSMCGLCAQHVERARVCPECIATYASNSKVGSSSSMVCCDICAFWVHTDCDPALAPNVYDALITLEDAPYVCPHCAAAGDTPLAPDSIQSPSDDGFSDDGMAALPRCLLVLEPSAASAADAAAGPVADLQQLSLETATTIPPLPHGIKGETEAANLLLSLTRSDVRFGRDRLDPDALELRFCTPGDWRQCALCGLRGDGFCGAAGPALGRLIPLRGRTDGSNRLADPVASRWVHVECLAWAWGPRPVSLGGGSGGSESPGTSPHTNGSSGSGSRLVQFEGALQQAEGAPCCTLCGRVGASFHCCAPVPCDEHTAFHLPCLLLSGSPTADVRPGQEQYSLAWRRALCSAHAPMFSAMMPADTDAAALSYSAVRVEARVDGLSIAPEPIGAGGPTLVGSGLVVVDWGSAATQPEQWTQPLPPGFRCVRVFTTASTLYSMGISVDHTGWSGWIEPGIPNDLHARNQTDLAPSLPALVDRLLTRQALPPLPTVPGAPLAAVLTRSATARPLQFLGLARCSDLPAILAAPHEPALTE